MFGVSGRRDGFESPGTTRGSLERAAPEGLKRGSKNDGDDEGGDSGGMGVRFEAGAETGVRVELHVGGSRGRDSGGEEFVSERGGFGEESGAAEELPPNSGERGMLGRRASKDPNSS